MFYCRRFVGLQHTIERVEKQIKLSGSFDTPGQSFNCESVDTDLCLPPIHAFARQSPYRGELFVIFW